MDNSKCPNMPLQQKQWHAQQKRNLSQTDRFAACCFQLGTDDEVHRAGVFVQLDVEGGRARMSHVHARFYF
jgi:hypothetical protein